MDETLDLVGLSEVARRRVGKFSLGMRQRLQLATALLGDPEILILDEPSNGLDPQGIQWLRTFIRHQASRGRAVLVSSHLLAEMEETVDDVIIISEGRLVLQTTLAELTDQAGTRTGLRIRTPELARLSRDPRRRAGGLPADGARHPGDRRGHPGVVRPVRRPAPDRVYELVQERGSLEEVFLSLTHGFDAADPAKLAARRSRSATAPPAPGPMPGGPA